MKKSTASLVLVCSVLSVASRNASPGPAPAAQLRARPLVHMPRMSAKVEIVDGVATCELVQLVRNEGDVEAEARWVLPLPEGAVADGFRMVVNGVETSGEVLDAAGARRVYEDIVRRRRDPGLLEYLGRGCLSARIFPIPARGEVTVEVGFRQVVPELSGLRRWSLALAAAGIEGSAPEQVVLDLAIRSRLPIRNVYSPSPLVHVVQKDDHEARASFEGKLDALPAGELAVYHGLSEAEFGLDLLCHRKLGEEGAFLMLISPKRSLAEQEILAKSIVFVADTSGSMEGIKLEQARKALRFFLGSLRAEDAFNVIPFSTEPEPFFPAAVPATSENLAAASQRVEKLAASGGTNIAGALAAALASSAADGRVPIVVFLTDGLPTVGEGDPAKILAAIRDKNAARTRLFVFGVGNDVNTHLLDTLAAENGGARDYVREHEDIADKTGALLTKLSYPVMTDLQLTVDGVELRKLVPAKLPDLFRGDRLELFGRYTGDGHRAIRLAGTVGGARREFVYEATFPAEATRPNDFVPVLWAERRVGVLLDAIRLNGPNPELVGEVERLGREYRIVTPYTSHLIVEDGLRTSWTGPGDSRPPSSRSSRRPWSAAGAGPASGRAGPTAPGAGAPAQAPRTGGGGDEFYLGGSSRAEAAPSFEQLTERLRDAEVLPKDAPPAELERLAREVAQELAAAEQSWNRLGREESGQKAVDESVYLARLVAQGAAAGDARLAELFTRRVKDKLFDLRSGVWTDRALAGSVPATRTTVEAFSSEYFALLTKKPELGPYFAFSTRMIVKLGDEVFEVVTH